jgi:hypothetical protein
MDLNVGLYIGVGLLTVLCFGFLGIYWKLRNLAPIKFKWPALMCLQLTFVYFFHIDLALFFFPDLQCMAVLICGFIAPFFMAAAIVRFWVIYTAAVTVKDSEHFEGAQLSSKTIHIDMRKVSKLGWFMKYRKYFNRKTYFYISILISFAFLLPFAIVLTAGRSSMQCRSIATIFALIMGLEMMVMAGVLTFILPTLARLKDSIGLKLEWKAMMMLPIFYIGGIMLYNVSGGVAAYVFAFLLTIYVPILLVLWATVLEPLQVTWKDFQLKREMKQSIDGIARSKSGSDNSKVHKGLKRELLQMLSLPQGMTMISVYSQSQLCAENIMFYKAVVSFKSDFAKLEADSVRQEYDNICTSFITNDSPYAVNISEMAQSVTLEFQKTDSSALIPEIVFDQALEEVLRMLAQDTFFRFRQTEEYKRLSTSAKGLSSIADVTHAMGIAPIPKAETSKTEASLNEEEL